MQHLMARYAGELLMIDATYKTMKYALPLFFLVVPTNVDFQIIAVFITKEEKMETIAEALRIVKSWNPDLHIKNAMSDYSLSEIGALEQIWEGKSA